MITDIARANAPHEWSRTRDYEHEVRLLNGKIADLKNMYGVDSLCLATSTLELVMSDESRSVPILLRWSELTSFNIETLGPIRPAPDGRVGIIGARLIGVDGDNIEFELEVDWLRVLIRAKSFNVIEQAESTSSTDADPGASTPG